MLRKLRVKFIVINMTIVTVMLCAIFGLLYHFTRVKLENESIAMMENIAKDPFQLGRPGKLGSNVQLPYFTLQVGINGELIATGGGYYDLSDEIFLKNITSAVFEFTDHIGVLPGYNLRFCRIITPVNQVLIFADTSSEDTTLKNLLHTSLALGALSFCVFLCISIFLARWAVKPVDKAWQQQKQFISDASHELKTPLAVIMTNAELLQDTGYDEESRNLFSSHILSMSKQMRSLLEQMLELARSDSMENKSVFSRFLFSQLVTDVVLSFEPLFFDKGLSLKHQVSEEIILAGDESRLHQVLDILLDNAGKYSSENGKILVRLERLPRSRCLLSVSNTGKAITPEQMKNLFKRFYRADEARSRDGSFGLGLSIAESIVMQHQGKIWAESKNGINTFYVELPIFC